MVYASASFPAFLNVFVECFRRNILQLISIYSYSNANSRIPKDVCGL